MKLKEAIEFLGENKTLDPYKADKYRFGKTLFREIIQLMEKTLLTIQRIDLKMLLQKKIIEKNYII